jgi:hypothetical protein
MRKAFDHVGIFTTEPQPDEIWIARSEVWITNPRKHPARIEYLRAKNPPEIPADQVGLWKLWHWPHTAYRVEDLRAALVGEEVVLGPFKPGDFVEVAFVHKHGGIIEYLQYAELGHWFGQPNPPGFRHEPLSR